ncbi:HSF-type DNA-binding-domain-containing protein [Blakeslea trispora]|nr:HSF-type DNA-binding-domain-containing protein [Blakeslea trispora]
MDHSNQRDLIHYPLRADDSNEPEWQPRILNERNIAGFVSKLYQCLQAPDDGHKYAYWCKHNGVDMFVIYSIPKFTEIVLPRLFKHCKFTSFVRQLNIYGFQRDTDARKSKDVKDRKTCRWHHVYFRPNRTDLFHLIRRQTPGYIRRKELQRLNETVLEDERVLPSPHDPDTTTPSAYLPRLMDDDLMLNPELPLFYSFGNQPMYDTAWMMPSNKVDKRMYEMHMHNKGSLQIEPEYVEYHDVIKSLTGELKKAQSLIEIQKSRIQCLKHNLLQYEHQFGSQSTTSSMSNSSSIGSHLTLYSTTSEEFINLGHPSSFDPNKYLGTASLRQPYRSDLMVEKSFCRDKLPSFLPLQSRTTMNEVAMSSSMMASAMTGTIHDQRDVIFQGK